jgi:hypothetical protein
VLLTAPLTRWWHLRWGATSVEARAAMSGDDLVPVSHFTATRAITIDARSCDVWPWLTQVGYGRADFDSYDLLDNLGRPSATAIMPQRQWVAVCDLAAPMASHPTPSTSFRAWTLSPGRVISVASRSRRVSLRTAITSFPHPCDPRFTGPEQRPMSRATGPSPPPADRWPLIWPSHLEVLRRQGAVCGCAAGSAPTADCGRR